MTSVLYLYISDMLEALVDKFRRDRNNVGVWSIFRQDAQRMVVAEQQDGTAKAVIVKDDGTQTEVEGKITVTRRDMGRPERQTNFVSDDGETTYLTSHEF